MGLNQAHDQHDDGAADIAASNICEKRRDIETGTSRGSASCSSSPTRSEHSQELATDATTNQASDGVADGVQVELLENGTGDVSANRAARIVE